MGAVHRVPGINKRSCSWPSRSFMSLKPALILIVIITIIPRDVLAQWIDEQPGYARLASCAEIPLSSIVRGQSKGCGILTSYNCFCTTSSSYMSNAIATAVQSACQNADDANSALVVFGGYCNLTSVASAPTSLSSTKNTATAQATPSARIASSTTPTPKPTTLATSTQPSVQPNPTSITERLSSSISVVDHNTSFTSTLSRTATPSCCFSSVSSSSPSWVTTHEGVIVAVVFIISAILFGVGVTVYYFPRYRRRRWGRARREGGLASAQGFSAHGSSTELVQVPAQRIPSPIMPPPVIRHPDIPSPPPVLPDPGDSPPVLRLPEMSDFSISPSLPIPLRTSPIAPSQIIPSANSSDPKASSSSITPSPDFRALFRAAQYYRDSDPKTVQSVNREAHFLQEIKDGLISQPDTEETITMRFDVNKSLFANKVEYLMRSSEWESSVGMAGGLGDELAAAALRISDPNAQAIARFQAGFYKADFTLTCARLLEQKHLNRKIGPIDVADLYEQAFKHFFASVQESLRILQEQPNHPEVMRPYLLAVYHCAYLVVKRPELEVLEQNLRNNNNFIEARKFLSITPTEEYRVRAMGTLCSPLRELLAAFGPT